ncbi:hypothetical protein [Rummeliibacillus pycnus]|uniref:hypothetical protein n=1 Tax=Rummeliibacillus pycnus TaxID=101070 RepID=UPI003D29D4DE
MKWLSISISVMGLCILLSAWILSNAIHDTRTVFPGSINVNEGVHEEYELLINNHTLYLIEKSTGQIFKKLDEPNAKWELVKSHLQ